jgi:fido (protein-threonine AMPylation protein)
MSLVEATALLPLDFEGIHPFIDGNGRTGCLLMNLELTRSGYPAIDVKFSDWRRYYGVDSRSGSAELMTLMVAEYVEEWLGQYLSILK